jgi:hypothetical protein
LTQDSEADSAERAPNGRPLDVGCRLVRPVLLAFGAAAALLPFSANSDHEAPFYPSFYPQEIKLQVLDPQAAVKGWSTAKVHAYAGSELFVTGDVPADAAVVTSLRSLLVLTFDAVTGRYAPASATARSRCDAAERTVPLLDLQSGGYVFHPYPITPYHADYLEQADRARQARSRYAMRAAKPGPEAIKVRAEGSLAQSLVPSAIRGAADRWDASLAEVSVESLTPPRPRGVVAPQPWLKLGWFQAYQLYAGVPALHGAAARAQADYQRLTTGAYRDAPERINLERALVRALTAGCERVVVGYTLRREYYNSEYSVGVENVAADSQTGLTSSIFPRTVKLKDFPWNGWLRVGLDSTPNSAWNPVGGLNDRFGRLLWAAVSDPALLPEPYGGGWLANRAEVADPEGPVSMPADALLPELGTGLPRSAGPGKTAKLRLRYSLVSSPFHDGSAPSVADVVYPYLFAFRWGSAARVGRDAFDPGIADATAQMREWLAGFKVIETQTRKRDYGGDMTFSYRVPVIDVYLHHRSDDPWRAGAAAPPWCTLPWEVMVLMEEAVTRGIGAFSEAEAQRRGIPWLDLARDKKVGEQLAALVETFRGDGYRPAALTPWVSTEEARERWTALAAFYAQYGHFLVTNGPYRLNAWTADSATLGVFRDLGYPLGVGTFDAYAIPLRGFVSATEDRATGIDIQAEIERVVRSQRSYDIARVPLPDALAELDQEERPVCAYVIIDRTGKVLRTGSVRPGKEGRFAIELGGLTAPGMYTVAAAVLIGGNRVNAEVRFIEHRAVAVRRRETASATK